MKLMPVNCCIIYLEVSTRVSAQLTAEGDFLSDLEQSKLTWRDVPRMTRRKFEDGLRRPPVKQDIQVLI